MGAAMDQTDSGDSLTPEEEVTARAAKLAATIDEARKRVADFEREMAALGIGDTDRSVQIARFWADWLGNQQKRVEQLRIIRWHPPGRAVSPGVVEPSAREPSDAETISLGERYLRMRDRQWELYRSSLERLELAMDLELASDRGPDPSSPELARRPDDLAGLLELVTERLRRTEGELENDRRWLNDHCDEELAAYGA